MASICTSSPPKPRCASPPCVASTTPASRAQRGEYRPLPLLRIVVEKRPGSTATRTLLVPCVRDRILQTAYATQLSRAFEEEFLEVSFAYRPGRGVDRAIARIRQLRDEGYWHIVDADIRAYFDNVDWGVLKTMLLERESPGVAAQLVDWMAAPYWDGERVRHRRRGVPRGSPVSPCSPTSTSNRSTGP